MNFNKNKKYMLEYMKNKYRSPASPIAYMRVEKMYVYFEKFFIKREI